MATDASLHMQSSTADVSRWTEQEDDRIMHLKRGALIVFPFPAQIIQMHLLPRHSAEDIELRYIDLVAQERRVPEVFVIPPFMRTARQLDVLLANGLVLQPPRHAWTDGEDRMLVSLRLTPSICNIHWKYISKFCFPHSTAQQCNARYYLHARPRQWAPLRSDDKANFPHSPNAEILLRLIQQAKDRERRDWPKSKVEMLARAFMQHLDWQVVAHDVFKSQYSIVELRTRFEQLLADTRAGGNPPHPQIN